MLSSIPLFVAYLMSILNMALFILVFLMLFEAFKYIGLFEMPAAMIIAACAAFVFVTGIPLVVATEQLLRDPQCSIYEVVLKSVTEILPVQFLQIMLGMIVWTIIKIGSSEKTKDVFQDKN